MSYAYRLHAYSPGTDTSLGFLPEPLSWEASFVHNDTGAMTIKYSTMADAGPLASRTLAQGLDVAVEVNWLGGPNDWVEPLGGRFLMVGRDADPTDLSKLITLKLVSWSWLLTKVCNLNTSAVEGSKSKHAGQRKMTTKDAGDIVKIFLDEHDARTGPAVPILRDSWTTSVDSAGNAWSKKKTIYYDLGADLHTIVDALVAGKMCDWRTQGRGLRMYNAGTAFADLSGTVRLGLGDELAEAPSTETKEAMVARLLVKGSGKHKVTVKDPDVPELYGRWEGFMDDGGVTDDDDLTDDGNTQLDTANRPRGEYTRQLTMAGTWLPWRDYGPGDWVTGPALAGMERMRVQQVTVTFDQQKGLSGNVVLNDRVLAADLRLASRVSSITGGTSAVAGSGKTVDPDLPDTRQPSAPTGLTLSHALYTDVWGRHQARLSASWDAVTTATDGTLLDIQGYELWGQPQTTPASTWRRVTQVTGTAVDVEGFEQGSEWLFAVQAVGVTTTETGQQSAQVGITFGVDEVAPNTPATPTVYPYLGTLVVGWNGLDSTGAAMPADFALCRVEVSTDGFVTWSVKDRFIGAGTVSLSGLTYDVEHQVRLVALDLSGNASGPSLVATGTPKSAGQILTGELDAGEVVRVGPAAGNHVELLYDGFYAYALTTAGVIPVIKLGTGDVDVFALTDGDGNRLASILGTGAASFKAIATDELTIGGFTVAEMMEALPRGLVGWYKHQAGSSTTSGTEIVWARFKASLQPNRSYLIEAGPHNVDVSATGVIAAFQARVAYDGASAEVTSDRIEAIRARSRPGATTISDAPYWRGLLTTEGQIADTRECSIAYTIQVTGGTGTAKGDASATDPLILTITDVGPAIPQTDSVIDRVSTWDASAVYLNGDSGADLLSGSGAAAVGDLATPTWAQAVFGGNAVSGETDKTIGTALAGATLVKAELILTAGTYPDNTASFNVLANTYTAANPATPSGTAVFRSKNTGGANWRAWHDISSIFTGASRGVQVGYPGAGYTSAAMFLYADTGSNKMQLRLTYRR